jgi:hypothetical protein
MKSYLAHYRNKYPGGNVLASENAVDVYDLNGNYRVALRKDGQGQWRDVGHELGASDQHDLSPIPKNARVHKLYPDGRVGLSEEASERKSDAKKLTVDGKVLSVEQYTKKGIEFDGKQNAIFPSQQQRVSAHADHESGE